MDACVSYIGVQWLQNGALSLDPALNHPKQFSECWDDLRIWYGQSLGWMYASRALPRRCQTYLIAYGIRGRTLGPEHSW
ncbi:hypothetical protein HI914_04692 [Erysiphe necator]|nr:hypothetical protein HI914_04692 [Erysiphe necator]